MADYQIQANKKKTIFYITYRVKKNDGSGKYKKDYVRNSDGSIVSFSSKPEAKKYQTSLRAHEDAKNSLQAARDRMAQKYGNHFDFLKSYLKKKKKEAPKSWDRSEWHMLHYVFLYFLFEQKEGNAENWSRYFDDFKEWLEDAPTIRKNRSLGGSKMAISSMNKIIGDLNGYLLHLHQKRLLITRPPHCEYITGAEDSYRTGEDIVETDEFDLVLKIFDEFIQDKEMDIIKAGTDLKRVRIFTKQLHSIKETKLLYIVCRHTGMRISEALGLSFGDFFPNPVKDENLNKLLAKNDLTSRSYIILKSQLGSFDQKTKKWKREPLKTKKKISLDNSRTVPIFNDQSQCDQILKKLHVETKAHFKITSIKDIKANEGQYLFFRHTNKNVAARYLKIAYQDLNLQGYRFKWKPFHCLRHTRATEIISKTHNQTLLKLILGHKSRVFERYVHLEASLAKKLTKDQESVLLEFNLDDPQAI